jgi:hypothetical protein
VLLDTHLLHLIVYVPGNQRIRFSTLRHFLAAASVLSHEYVITCWERDPS